MKKKWAYYGQTVLGTSPREERKKGITDSEYDSAKVQSSLSSGIYMKYMTKKDNRSFENQSKA